MTDITELAQSLKAAAEKATNGQWVAFTDTASRTFSVHTPDDNRYGDVIKWTGFDGQRKAKANAEFIALANPANVLALVEALEKAQQRIAELESRTVTVKLPKPHAHLIWIQAGHAPDDYWDDVAVSHSEKDRCCDGSERYPVYARWEIEEMLTAAGIKVEVE
ncbi:TPA: ead/Ea22-like family protein [Klebsiella pneumoniae]|nr:ead/Ea22-like family protein [Klebsiella pneumoniae]HEE5136976.1 ead/Ea22-like family protein [Klebsiella pneumoniae]HEJ0027487.1 ead/Ea22-like family protein [Klebsiella pneumoniae]